MRIFLFSCLAMLFFLGSSLHAEERTFFVTVDGKQGGSCRMKATTNGDVDLVEMNYDVKIRVLGIKYEYQSKCVEEWKNGLLQKLDCLVNDDGARSHVKAESSDRGLITTVKGRSAVCAKDALPATGWRIPRMDKQTQEATILDNEDGSTCVAKITYIGKTQLKVGELQIEAYKYKVVGKGIDAEWAFDSTGRPVWQSMKWDGHNVVLSLSGIEK